MTYLRLRFTAPTAHYRIPFTYKVRQSYPIPPYSTVVGLMCNILGEKDSIDAFLGKPFGLAVCGRYTILTREYTWFRNLLPAKHTKRFMSKRNRYYDQVPEHPGYQSPVTVEILNDVETVVYLDHPDRLVTSLLQENLFHPERWINHLHLGRAEDWIVLEGADVIKVIPSSRLEDPSWTADRGYFWWLPHPGNSWGLDEWGERSSYNELFERVQGTPQLITTLYRIEELSGERAKMLKRRSFHRMPGKLCCGQIPLLRAGGLPRVLVDPELKLPLFPACIPGGEDFAHCKKQWGDSCSAH